MNSKPNDHQKDILTDYYMILIFLKKINIIFLMTFTNFIFFSVFLSYLYYINKLQLNQNIQKIIQDEIQV